IAYDMPYSERDLYGEWIWVPPGFAHGNLLMEDSRVEYFCTGEHNPEGEAGISPLAGDIDWSLCDTAFKKIFDEAARYAKDANLISAKDINGLSLAKWLKDCRSDEFTVKKLSLQNEFRSK
ncbi:MAG: dTDP-4-dehydrorhamnose 3,5-epimerase family protein, partial [Candidatus Spechtbacterales bacterium]